MNDLQLMENTLEALQGLLDQPGDTATYDSCMFRALTAADALRQRLARPAQYQRDNPLGGPAKVFDAMADAIRAGDDYHQVLRQFGYAEASLQVDRQLRREVAAIIEQAVRQDEREQCAKAADRWATADLDDPLYQCDCAAAIRARGQQ